MTEEDRRRELELEIAELSETWRNTADAAAKAAIKSEMDKLRAAVNAINLEAAEALVARVDGILAKLEEVRTQHSIDAVSALGNSIRRLRSFRDRLASGEA